MGIRQKVGVKLLKMEALLGYPVEVNVGKSIEAGRIREVSEVAQTLKKTAPRALVASLRQGTQQDPALRPRAHVEPKSQKQGQGQLSSQISSTRSGRSESQKTALSS